MKIFLSFIIFTIISKILAITDFSKDEVTQCMSTIPTGPSDCLKTKFTSLVCCAFQMTIPHQGLICVPMSTAAIGYSKVVNTTLPEHLPIAGNYTCGSEKLNTYRVFMSILMIIFIFCLY
jgi:hypothetical protein